MSIDKPINYADLTAEHRKRWIKLMKPIMDRHHVSHDDRALCFELFVRHGGFDGSDFFFGGRRAAQTIENAICNGMLHIQVHALWNKYIVPMLERHAASKLTTMECFIQFIEHGRTEFRCEYLAESL